MMNNRPTLRIFSRFIPPLPMTFPNACAGTTISKVEGLGNLLRWLDIKTQNQQSTNKPRQPSSSNKLLNEILTLRKLLKNTKTKNHNYCLPPVPKNAMVNEKGHLNNRNEQWILQECTHNHTNKLKQCKASNTYYYILITQSIKEASISHIFPCLHFLHINQS